MTKDEFEAWFKTSEGQEIVTPIIDKAVTKGIKSFSENHPSINEEEVMKRLAGLEAKYKEKDLQIAQERLDHYLFRRCVELKMPYELFKDLSFQDTDEVDNKLEQFAREFEKKRAQDINEMMADDSFKPGSGKEEDKRKILEDYSEKDLIELEEIKGLDLLLE